MLEWTWGGRAESPRASRARRGAPLRESHEGHGAAMVALSVFVAPGCAPLWLTDVNGGMIGIRTMNPYAFNGFLQPPQRVPIRDAQVRGSL